MSAQTCSGGSPEVVGRTVEERGCANRLAEAYATTRVSSLTSQVGSRAHLLLDRPQPTDEQGLRETCRDERGIHLRGDEPPDGEETDPFMRLFGRSQKAHSRKLVVASPSTNIRHIANRTVSPWDPAAFCRGIATPAARICYEELQVVAAELRENYSCVALCVLRGR